MKTNMATVFLVAAMILALTVSAANAAWLPDGAYSNFTITNLTGQAVNGFELTLRGNGLTCNNLTAFYKHWGTVWDGTRWVPSGGCQDLGGSRVKMIWSDPSNPIAANQKQHFGAQFAVNTPGGRVVEAFWTYNGVKAGNVSVTWPTWIPTDSCPVAHVVWAPDSIPTFPDIGPPWEISRAWAWTPVVLPLDSLIEGNPLIVSLGWSATMIDNMSGDPNDSSVLWTDPLPQQGALVVQYAVLSEGGDTLAVFTDEVALETGTSIPTLTEWGLIILAALVMGCMAWVFVRQRRRAMVSL
ncbi:MAG: hypothetical protein ABIJ61_14575 [bacterium]